MSGIKSIDNMQITRKATELAESLNSLLESLPSSEIYNLKMRIKESADNFPLKVRDGLKNTRRIERIRSMISAQGILEDCRSDLSLVKSLKYADTETTLAMVDEVSDLLNS